MTDARTPLLNQLSFYETNWPTEKDQVTRLRNFVSTHPDCFMRTCIPGHLTASGVVVTEDFQKVLLTHHKKLGVWLQLGGHCDGNPDTAQVALQECLEEGGLTDLRLYEPGPSRFYDIDVHLIPAWKNDPEHMHYDIRYIVLTSTPDAITISSESNDLRWFSIEEAYQVANQRSMHRLFEKIELINLQKRGVSHEKDHYHHDAI